MEQIKLSGADKKFLQKELASVSQIQAFPRYRRLPYVDNPDPILSFLAMNDERAYRIMERNNTAVGAARQVRQNNLLSPGSSIIIGSSRSRHARMLKEFCIAFFKQIENYPEVQNKIYDTFMHGWRPMECVWSPMNFRRKTYLVPRRIIDKDQEHFRFTPDRFLCHINRMDGKVDIFNNDVDQLKWLVFTYGSIDNPYGNGIYQRAWLINYAKDKFFEMFSTGMQRSMGVLRLKQGFTHPVSESQGASTVEPGNIEKVFSDVSSQISQIMQYFNSENVLIEKAGWTAEFLNNVNFADGWIKALEYVDKEVTLIIATESLSFQEAQFGSRAQAVVHAESGNKTAQIDGKFFDNWVNEQIVKKTLEYNFGEIDPDDMPKMLSHARIPLDMNIIKSAFDMGISLDADEIARRFNLPIATEETENILKMKDPVATPGPNKQDTRNSPKKQVQKADEQTRGK